MINLLILLSFLNFGMSDTIHTNYARMCDLNKKTALNNCDEMMLNASFVFSDTTEYIYQFVNRYEDTASNDNLSINFYTRYSVDTCFEDSVSKKYIFKNYDGQYMFVRYFTVPMIKVYFFNDKENKVTQTIYFNTKFFKEQ